MTRSTSSEALELIQTKDPTERPGYSLYPREIVTVTLKPGLYYARVKDRSHNFDGRQDRLRLTASGDSISMPEHDTAESILNPADLGDVIVVGASDSEKNSVSQSLHKPEVTLTSLIKLQDGSQYKGSSTSAAMAAAWIGIVKSIHVSWDRKALLDAFPNPSGSTPPGPAHPGQGLSLSDLGFSDTGNGCFVPTDLSQNPIPPYVRIALNYGGTLVETTAGRKIFYDFDPITLMPTLHRLRFDDILVIGPPTPMTPNGNTGLFPRSALWNLAPGLIEVLQTPAGATICGR